MTGGVAVIDIGTISCRLLALDADGASLRRDMRITRTGEGLAETGRLAGAAIDRVVAAVSSFMDEVRRHAITRVEIVATSAARDAENQADLLAAIEGATGVTPRVLSGREEARLAFTGAVTGLDRVGVADDVAVLVVDIGGGSTEFAVGSRAAGMESSMSVDTGAARVTDAYFESDPPGPAELSAALSVIELHLDDVQRELPGWGAAVDAGVVVGVGGTITTVAAVEIGLADHDRDLIHGFELTRDAAEDVFRTLATESADDRRHNPGLHPDRVDLIVGGACVLVETMRQFNLETILVSEDDLLDAVAREMLQG